MSVSASVIAHGEEMYEAHAKGAIRDIATEGWSEGR